MRQFLFGLLCAALVWWVYSAWSPAQAEGSSSGGDQQDAQLLKMLHDSAVSPPAAPAATAPQNPAAPAVEAAVTPAADLAGMLGALRSGDAAGFGQAWRMLADPTTSSASRSAILQAMAASPADDVAKVLAVLGENNAFLHSAEGLAVAQRALQLAAAEAPEASALHLTQLLEKCMRGDIAKTDAAIRAFVDKAAKELRRQVDHTLCDPSYLTRARSHTVGGGETLDGIAKHYKKKEQIMVEAMTLAMLNRISNPRGMRAGQKIKIPLDPIKTVVEKRSFLMAVYVGDVMLRIYWVGHGLDDKTPVTTFKVTEILPNPEWDAPDGRRYPPGSPENILGKWFVKLAHDYYQGFGIHGTTQPETIGTMASMGCIRMLDPDIEEYATFVPRGSLVEIRDSK